MISVTYLCKIVLPIAGSDSNRVPFLVLAKGGDLGEALGIFLGRDAPPAIKKMTQ